MVENHEFTEAVNFSVCHEFFWLLWFVVIFIAALLCQNSWISCANHYKWPHLSLSGALNRVFTYCLTKDVKQTRYRWAHTHTYSMKILTISKLSQVAPTYITQCFSVTRMADTQCCLPLGLRLIIIIVI